MNELSIHEETPDFQSRPVEFPPRREFHAQDVEDLFRLLGVDPASIEPRLREAMGYLGSYSETMNDESRARAMADVMASYCSRVSSPNGLSKEGWRYVNLASMLSDIGKVGPRQERIDDVNHLITALYAKSEKFSPDDSLSHFLDHFFPSQKYEMQRVLVNDLGLELTMSMRSFWDAHAQWTLDHLKDSGVPNEVALTAAAHHLLGGDKANPRLNELPIVEKTTGTLRGFGIERPIDQREIWVVLLDKYEANMQRGGATHEEAITWLRTYLETNQMLATLPRLKGLFLSCLDDLDAARPLGVQVGRDEESLAA
ncbi:MAG: hypothetical protein UY76_C0003G0014 [Candidatus Uhrbacteria bacterium GW2011_GWA2_52_8d]|uniref:Uncharacterized protein n=1 Tax=Candidatus Uhrbacteria bacterium GW2011_GWA2_52_8d TaxID=1618979 RepID=A0A0G2AL97_9BACT|nr:MAG: hypothetical protein UY76_C0003G0014 [Candidatus Uhrbacteria bacterium GW2011_GWA2_52_8d]